MRSAGCEQSELIGRAAGSLGLTREQSEHASECPDCADAVAVARFMEKIGRPWLERPLPDPNRIWVRAQFERQQHDRDRILRPISILHVLAYAVSAVAPVTWILWKWPQIYAWISDLQRGHVSIPSGGVTALSLSFMWMGAGILGVLALFTVHFMLAEEW